MTRNNKLKTRLNSRAAVRWLWIALGAPIVLLLLLMVLVSLGAFGRLPTFEELENPRSNIATAIYSEDGEIIGSYFYQNRSFVDYTDLNDSLVAALVSTEDMRFYSHSGIDFIALARVGMKTGLLRQREQGGGSTITQQLAKNLFPRDTVQNRSALSKAGHLTIAKLKEWVTAVKLEHNYTKEEIIAMYLNTMEYGSNAFGIQSAARTFFNKEPSELTINEAALLVGVVNAPTRYSPVRNPDNALRRRNVVLSRMREIGFITRAQRDSLSAIPIALDFRPISHNTGIATYFREMLRGVMTMPKPQRSDAKYNRSGDRRLDEWTFRQELHEWETNPLFGWVHKNSKPDGTPYNIFSDGLRIYTTINSTMQRYAEEAVYTRLENEIQPAMEAQYRNTRRIFRDQNQAQQKEILFREYRSMRRREGLSDAELQKIFDTPSRMTIFTYKGDRDTLMTPYDSLLHYKKLMRASFVAMNPVNGHVRAYVGGPDYRYFKYDMARQGKRQVGSTIKSFIYTFAIDHLGLSPCTMVENVQYVYETPTGDLWAPGEAGDVERLHDGTFHPLQWGLALSRNNYSVWIMRQGKNPQAVTDLIHKMGISSFIDPVPALALGSAEFSLFELVGAYATFANNGVFTDPIFVTRIEDRYGNVISSFTPTTSDAISPQVAFTMLQMLQTVTRSGTAGSLRTRNGGFTGEMAGKTGTSNDNRDAWFVGLVPQLVAGAWVGADDQRTSLTYRGEGSVLALPIYAEFMRKVYANPRLGITQADRFRIPEGAVIYDCSRREEVLSDTTMTTVSDEFFD
ncbi:MAG: transglycosylase domain-containing protein [Rikenellaceae bacterium]|nr:transglycosylase domain-containing protein [Rikenellaceae bacterium]MCL2693227.1 transglycosylase domain-containing protein [Rikenellaceae bacterium]